MKKILFASFVFIATSTKAQLTPVAPAPAKTIGTPTVTNPTGTVNPATQAPASTTTATQLPLNNAPGSNATDGKLNNLPVKTPMYNSSVTGTNSPGDQNTGIPANNNVSNKNAPVVAPVSKYPVANKTNVIVIKDSSRKN